METMIVKFQWDDKKLAKGWFNRYSLELCLYSPEHTAKDFLNFEVIEYDSIIKRRKNDLQDLW